MQSHGARTCLQIEVRVIELHEAGAGGNLKSPRHYDTESCVTVDVLVSENADFEGTNSKCHGTDSLPDLAS